MSQHEIEDVLSSIRRLVSEDLKPMVRINSARTSGEATAETAPKPLRLGEPASTPLETIRFRVSGAEAAAPPAQAAPLVLTAALRVEDLGAAEPKEEVVSRLGAALPSDQQDWESPDGDLEDLPPADLAFRSLTDASEGATVSEPASSAADMAPEEDVAQDRAPEPEPPAIEDIQDWHEEPAADQPEFHAQDGIEIAETSDETWADAAEAAAIEDIAREAAEAINDDVQEQSGGMTFDEEVLRDLVRDILREELAGSLGERITRNVRKLVRAEIARAIAVREFE